MSTNKSDYIFLNDLPDVREPVLLAGFSGWNDAAQAATFGLTTLVNSWSAGAFAEIDPESFYDFTETRPTIAIGPTGQRRLTWPSNKFYAHQLPEVDRDVVLLIGAEPQLHWRTFCQLILEVAEKIGASSLVTLGGLLADVPHTVEPRLTGFATSAKLLPQLQTLGVRMSSYEGPTGVIGALHDAWHNTGRPALSLWGHVPHYISATPNPQISLALLQRVAALLDAPLPLGPLEAQARAFRLQIDEALQSNPEATDYVRQLEETYEQEAPSPPAPELIQELENFLRSNRPSGEEPQG